MFLVCDSSPCLNEGTCVNSGSGFACQCPTKGLITSTGDWCETVVCNATTECNGKGICFPPRSGSTTRCNCQSPFTGPNCEDRINACITFKGDAICKAANETCIDRAGLHFECGNPCNVSGVLCHNGGTCSPRINAMGFTCACPEGYTGAVCDILMPTTPTASVTAKTPTATASKPPVNATTPAANITDMATASSTASEPPVNATSPAVVNVTSRTPTNITASPVNGTQRLSTAGEISLNDLDDWIIAVIIVACVVVIVLLLILIMCLCRQQSSSYSPKAMDRKLVSLGLNELPRADPLIS